MGTYLISKSLSQEISEMRSNQQTSFTVETDGLPTEYDNILREKLQELREEFEEEAELARQELEDAYKAKVVILDNFID